jgi:alkanesulfonate monooxygenase SsuD/methylene tetrahydromethanopterin reductase-like flavin-dependent oxidoreductase (luciferase family)
MKFGIYLPNFGPFGDARVLASLAQDAEKSGWDGFFLWDHIAGMGLNIVDTWVALTAIAVNTQRIRIGTTVTPLPRRRPWKVARETVSVDRLSEGRLTLGVGIGGGEWEWGDLGEQTDLKERGAMLDEALSILTGLWTGEPFQFDGHYFHVKETQFLPKPVQSPRIPIWVGGLWPHKAPLRRAAQWDGVFPLFFGADSEEQELAQLKEAVSYITAQRTNPMAIELICTGFTFYDKQAQASEMIGQRALLGMTWWLESITPSRFSLGFKDEWPVDAMRERILQGPPSIG